MGPVGQEKYTFPKAEKLVGKKRIEGLFKKGSSFYLSDFRVRYQPSEDGDNVHKVLITVSKRNFKRAVDRNLLKRRIREAYRLNKHLLAHQREIKPLNVGFIYLSKRILTFQEIQDQLIKCLKRLEQRNAERNE